MEFTFEPIERRDIKVEVPRLGQLPGGLVLEGVEVTPKSVTVKGARSELRQVKVIETEPVDLSEFSSSSEIALALRAVSSALSISTKSVTARVQVGQVPSQRHFSDRPLEVRMAQGIGKFEVNPSAVSVTVSGPPDVIVKLSAADVIPFIRLTELPGDSGSKVKVQVDLPASVKAVSVEPVSVSIEQDKAVVNRKPTKRSGR
jgi:YbbR domain-containing protein